MAGSWNLFTAINSGQLTQRWDKNEVELEVRVSFTRMLAIVTVMVFGFMGSFLLADAKMEFPVRIGLLCVGWSWLFGMNYLISVLRLRSWVKALINSGLELPQKTPWWKFDEGAGSKIGQPLKEFQPKWQPAWLEKIRWRWKAPLIIWTAVILWNAILFPFVGPSFTEIRHHFGLLVYVMWAFSGIFIIIGPYLLGLGIEHWNEQIRERIKKNKYN